MTAVVLRAEEFLGRLLLGAIVALVFISAVTRSVGYPIIWSVDLAQALFIWLCFFGAIHALRLRAHIGVDYFVKKLPMRFRWVIDLFLAVVVIAFLATMAWFGTQLTLLNWQRTFGDSGISYAWVTAAVPIGCAFLAIVMLVQLVEAIRTGSLIFVSDEEDEADAERQEV